MSDGLIVCFRFPDLGAPPEVHFATARELLSQAVARGAEPVATGIELYAFELDLDALEDAIELAVAVAGRQASGGLLAVGISQGPLARSEALGEKLKLVWGPPLAAAALLSCVAEPGEVLVDGAVGAAARGQLATTSTRVAAHGGLRVHGLLLDKQRPWRDASLAAAVGSVVVSETHPDASPDSEGDIDLLSSVPPRSGPARSAVAALRTGDFEAVDRMAEKVRVDEGRTDLADRLRAMAHLGRGETADAIRRLEAAAESARRESSPDQCRAALALAVALSAGGRHEDALLQALEALARARESRDARGERASLHFLARLATLNGQVEVATRWTELAES